MSRAKYFKVEVRLDNAAFDKATKDLEISRILRDLSEQMGKGQLGPGLILRDINGNAVGAAWEERPDEEG